MLRAERLAPIVTPDCIVVSFLPHDVRRCAILAGARALRAARGGVEGRKAPPKPGCGVLREHPPRALGSTAITDPLADGSRSWGR